MIGTIDLWDNRLFASHFRLLYYYLFFSLKTSLICILSIKFRFRVQLSCFFRLHPRKKTLHSSVLRMPESGFGSRVTDRYSVAIHQPIYRSWQPSSALKSPSLQSSHSIAPGCWRKREKKTTEERIIIKGNGRHLHHVVSSVPGMEEEAPLLGHLGRSLSNLFTQCASPNRVIVLSIDDITNGDGEFLLDDSKRGK